MGSVCVCIQVWWKQLQLIDAVQSKLDGNNFNWLMQCSHGNQHACMPHRRGKHCCPMTSSWMLGWRSRWKLYWLLMGPLVMRIWLQPKTRSDLKMPVRIVRDEWAVDSVDLDSTVVKISMVWPNCANGWTGVESCPRPKTSYGGQSRWA